MFAPEDVSGILITMLIEEEPALFILLTKDGTANRMVTGSEDISEKDLFIAKTNGEMFETLRSRSEPEKSQWEGGFSDPSLQGKTCQLTVSFKNDAGEESTCKFQYGTESQGPPPDLCNLVISAIEITDPWYEEQKQQAADNRE